jgi:hypothetical protein
MTTTFPPLTTRTAVTLSYDSETWDLRPAAPTGSIRPR